MTWVVVALLSRSPIHRHVEGTWRTTILSPWQKSIRSWPPWQKSSLETDWEGKYSVFMTSLSFSQTTRSPFTSLEKLLWHSRVFKSLEFAMKWTDQYARRLPRSLLRTWVTLLKCYWAFRFVSQIVTSKTLSHNIGRTLGQDGRWDPVCLSTGR
jgi:hypothetical protein